MKTVIVHLHIYSQLPMRTSAGTAYSSRLHVFTQVDCRVRSIFSFLCNVLWIILCLVVLCFVCPSIYGFRLPLPICLPLECLSIELRLLITPSNLFTIGVSVHRVTASDYPFQFVYHWSVCPSITPSNLFTIGVSVLRVTASDYPFQFVYHWSVCPSSYGFRLPLPICLPLECLSFELRLPITPSNLFTIGVSVHRVTASDYPFQFVYHWSVCPSSYGFRLPLPICLPLECLSIELRLPITPSNLFTIGVSVLRVTASDYPFQFVYHWSVCPSSYGFRLPLPICLPLECLSFELRLPITPSNLFTIGVSVHRVTASDYPFQFVYHWSVSIELRLPITPSNLFTIGVSVLRVTASDNPFQYVYHWSVCPSSYGFRLPLPICLPLECLSFELRLPITPSNLFTIGVSVHRVTASDYPFQFVYHWSVCPSSYGFRLPLPICLPLECLSFELRLPITPSNLFTIGVSVHRVTASYPFQFVTIGVSVLRVTASDYPFQFVYHWSVCPSSYGFRLPLPICLPLECLSIELRLPITPSNLFTIGVSVLRVTASHYLFQFVYHWSVSFELRLPITPSNLFTIGVSVLRVTASDYPFQFVYHWSVCPSSYGFRLPLPICLPLECLSFELRLPITPSNLFTIGVSVLRVTASDYPFQFVSHWSVCPSSYGFSLPLPICLPLECLSFELRLPITPSNLFTIGVSVLRVTASDYPFQFVYHWSVCPSSYGFRLPLPICLPLECLSFELRLPITPSNLFTIGVSVLRVTASDYPFQFVYHWSVCPSSYGFRLPLPICLPLECLSFELRLLITFLHWNLFTIGVFCPSSYGFRLPLPICLPLELSFELRLLITSSNCLPLECLSFELRLPITPSNLFTIGVSVLRVTASDYPFQFVYHWSVCPSSYGFRLPLPICLPLECLSFELRLPITPSNLFTIGVSVLRLPLPICLPLECLSFDYPFQFVYHWSVCPSSYGFSLPLWYFLLIFILTL